MMKRLHVIVNPAAGQDKPMLSILNSIFHEAGITWEVFVTNDAGDAQRFAVQSAQADIDAVAVYGGDGTIMEAIGGLVGTKMPLVILPGGTGNGASYELGIPADLAQACQLVCGDDYDIREIDIGKADNNYFLLNAGVGLATEVMQNTDRASKDRFGLFAYLMTGIQTMRDLPVAKYHLTIDGEKVETEGITCVIANAGAVSNVGVKLAANVDIADGLLDVIVIRNVDIGTILSVAATTLTGSEDKQRLQHWQAREIILASDPPQTIQLDGDVAGSTPVTIRVIPKGLRVAVPRKKTDTAVNAGPATEPTSESITPAAPSA